MWNLYGMGNYGFGWGRGFGRGWGGGFGRGWGRGNPYPFCMAFPWLPRGWRWGTPAYYGNYPYYAGYPYYGYSNYLYNPYYNYGYGMPYQGQVVNPQAGTEKK